MKKLISTMKKVILLVSAVTLLFASCKKEKENVKPDYSRFQVHVSGMKPTLKALSNAEVVKNAYIMVLNNRYLYAAQRDTINNELLIPAHFVITSYGELGDFITYRDNVIINREQKVIAYIPNSISIKGETLIRNAYNSNKLDSCIWYLKNHYKFIPINDEDYQRLKLNNEQ